MFRFENPAYLYILLLIPVLVLVYMYGIYKRKKSLQIYGDLALIKKLIPDVSRTRPYLKFVLLLCAVAAFALLLARPQFGTKLEVVKRQGVEVIIALDISNSMMAQDIEPNRLERAKRLIAQLIDKMENDKVGLIIFAGDAYTQLPITNDYISAKMFLSSIETSLISKQGTAIGSALLLAGNSFTPNPNVGKAVIVITDGENHEGGVDEAVKSLVDKNIQIDVLGLGTPEGSPIPLLGSNDYKRDSNGQVVISRLNESMCRDIARKGNGVYAKVDNTNTAFKAIQNDAIDKLAKADMESKVFSEYNEQFQAVAWIILFLLLLEAILYNRKNPIFKVIHLLLSRK